MHKTLLPAVVLLLALSALVLWAAGPATVPGSVGAQQLTPPVLPPSSEAEALAREGFQQATRLGCTSCHSTTGQRILGPSFLGFYGNVVVLDDGSIAWIDEAYLRQTITDPGTHAVAGFPGDIMPDYSAVIDEQELTALIAFLRSIGVARYGVVMVTPAIPPATVIPPVEEGSPTPVVSPEATAPAATLSPAARAGRLNLTRFDCVRCHSLDGSDSLGPTLTGVYGREVTLEDGTTVVADEEYLRTSILDHDAQIVAEYPAGLAPSYAEVLNEAQVNAIIAFLREFSEGTAKPEASPAPGTATPAPTAG